MSERVLPSEGIFDAYLHCGISKYLPVENVLSIFEQHGISGGVLVQHMGEFDNSYIGDCLVRFPDRFVGIGLLDRNGDWRGSLKQLSPDRGWRGVRIDTATLVEAPHLCRECMAAGLDLVIYIDRDVIPDVEQRVAGLAKADRERRLVLSHYAIADNVEAFDRYGLARRLAVQSNVSLLLSGQAWLSEAPFDAYLGPTRDALDWYGPERLMWGSNFPVCGEGALYSASIDFLRSKSLGLSRLEVDQILARTAAALWFG